MNSNSPSKKSEAVTQGTDTQDYRGIAHVSYNVDSTLGMVVTMRTKLGITAVTLFLASVSLGAARAAVPDDSKTVPVIDGAIGPCTADFTITDADGKPLYDAKIKVHIAYRFLNAHKLDLEVGTNVDGKARFTGLPEKIKHGLYFYATQGDLQAEAFDDPANNCKAQFTLALKKKEQ